MTAKLDLTGQRFARLTVVNEAPRTASRRTRWNCYCECGTKCIVQTDHLRSDHTISCGCECRRRTSNANLQNITGKKFGRLLVVNRAHNQPYRASRWKCVCDCGNETTVNAHDLKTGNTKSCGCLHKDRIRMSNSTHGYTINAASTRTYNSWLGMHTRCYNPNVRSFSDYGARGLTVCERWAHFESFLEDMGQCPDGMQIDRIDNNLGYSPENCRWTTPKQNARNRRSNRTITAGEKTLTIAEWSEIIGISARTIWARLNAGWSDKMAVRTPLQKITRAK